MASYQDLTFNYGQYVPQYAGAPLQEIADTASQLSERHYSNLARLNQLQLLREQAKSKVLPGAKSYIDQQFGDIDQALAEIAQSGGENSTARISAMANRFLGDQGVLRATEAAEQYQKFLDTQRAMKAQGKSPVYNKALEQKYLNTPVVDPETGQMSSIYNDPFKLTTEPYIEPVPEIDKLWEVIKPDSMESSLGKRDYLMLSRLIPQVVENGAIDMPMFYEMAKKSGISADKIKRFTEAVKRQVDTSDLGRQAREYETLTPQQMDDLILQRGLMRVYSNTDRTVVQSGITDDLLRKGAAAIPGVKSPLPAKVREKFDPGFSASQIDESGTVKPTLFESLISSAGMGDPEALRLNAKLRRDEAFNAKDPETRKFLFAEANKLEKEATENEKTLGQRSKERTDNMLSYMKTAMEVAGQNTDNLDDTQIKAIASTENGQKLLKDYLDQYAGLRYHSPYINNIVDEKVRKANEDFLRGNFSQREFIDMATGEHFTGLKDEDGEVQEGLLDLSKALQDNKLIVEGTIDPKHIFTGLSSNGDNFTRALRVQVPVGKDGQMREFLVSQPTNTTATQDINENLLYNAATEAPGRWSDVGNNTKVISPASDAQKEILWQKYGNSSGLMKDDFMSNEIVILDRGEGIEIFPNYTVAAQYLAEHKGIKLTKQKRK